MIDEEGYRPNVAIVLINSQGLVFWARRARSSGWQFPQGGMNVGESARDALFRELQEETGLEARHVEILGQTRDWLYYDIPEALRRRDRHFRGQKQRWFLLRFLGTDADVQLDACRFPEFDEFSWIAYWDAPQRIVDFKREVYERALRELETFLP